MPVQIVLIAPGKEDAFKHEQAAPLECLIRQSCPQVQLRLVFAASAPPLTEFKAESDKGRLLFLPLFVLPGQEFTAMQDKYGFAGHAAPAACPLLEKASVRAELADCFQKQQRLGAGEAVLYLAHTSAYPEARACLRAFEQDLQQRCPAQFIFSFSPDLSLLQQTLASVGARRVILRLLTVFYGQRLREELEGRQGITACLQRAGFACSVDGGGLIVCETAQAVWLRQLAQLLGKDRPGPARAGE